MNPAKGWYDDPTAPGRLRWWDGERWTELTRVPTLAEDSDPAPAEPTPAAPTAPPSSAPVGSTEPTPGPALAPDDELSEALFPETRILRPPETRTAAAGERSRDDAMRGGDGRRADAPPLPPLAAGEEVLVTLPGGTLGEGMRGRRAALLASGALVLVVGVVAAVAFSSLGSGNIFDLRVGDCFDDDPGSLPEVREINDVPEVECEAPHDNEVFAAFNVDLPAFPGGATLGDQAIDGCVSRFREVVGFPMDLTDLDVSAFWPTQTSWDQGDREVLCFLFRFDRAKLVGSRIGLADGVEQAVFRLEEGDCFDAPLRDAPPGEEVEGVQVQDCGLPHFAEVYEVVTFPAGPYPPSDELAARSQASCLEAFEPAFGQPFEGSVLWFNALPPTASSWEAGDRDVLCYAYDQFGGSIQGSARLWALANRDDVLDFGEGVDTTGLAVGDCFNDPVDGRVGPIGCDTAHDNEVFLVVEAPDSERPEQGGLDEWIGEQCDPAFSDWVGPDRQDLTWVAFQPSKTTWEAGDRRVLCALYDIELAKLVGSQKRAAV